jgi:hypothetical protein
VEHDGLAPSLILLFYLVALFTSFMLHGNPRTSRRTDSKMFNLIIAYGQIREPHGGRI